jgi:hypothetical protein
MRKIIQIETSRSGDYMTNIVALCDDGTVWINKDGFDGQRIEWKQIEGIPQDETTHVKSDYRTIEEILTETCQFGDCCVKLPKGVTYCDGHE